MGFLVAEENGRNVLAIMIKYLIFSILLLEALATTSPDSKAVTGIGIRLT